VLSIEVIMKLDKQEITLIGELVRNPRLSDNQLAKISSVPLKTINRKRKKLEQAGIINYLVAINNSPEGTEDFSATVLYIIRFKYGIFRKQFLDRITNQQINPIEIKHLRYTWLGEQDGRLVLILMIESRLSSDILEIFNVEVLGKLRSTFGHDIIEATQTIPITTELVCLHNYSIPRNMANGRIRDDWPRDLLFVSDSFK
jgi:DNA-binding Lrp family transcriptional regulator